MSLTLSLVRNLFSKPLFSPTYDTLFRFRALTRYYSTSNAFDRIKHPQRGGQNITERYRRLEKSVRGKEALSAEYGELQRSTLIGPNTTISPSSGRPSNTFRGLTIPDKPKEPESDECCMSGCAICVYDLYEESLSAYKDAVAKITATLTSMGVPESDWPSSLQTQNVQTERKKDVTLSAFEEMERTLQKKSGNGMAGTVLANATDNMGSEKLNLSISIFTPRTTRVKDRRRTAAWNLSDMYEGIRWVFFSNR